MFISDSKTQGRLTAGILLAVFIGLFAMVPYATGYGDGRKPIAYWLWYFWRSPEWQHGALVPLILGAIIWKKRALLAKLPLTGSNAGLGIVALAMVMYLAGHRSNLYYLGYASCHFLIIGVILWIAGWKWLKQLSFPLCFLVFLWPLYFLESQVGFPLRMLMTDLSSGILKGLSVEHIKSGTAIVSIADPAAGLDKGARFALEVANPCSGIRSLFALMMIGALYGYLVLTKPRHWLALSISAIPFAIAGNVVRILTLTGGSIAFGSEFAIGKDGSTSNFHFLAGIAVFFVAASGMFLFGKLLSKPSWPFVRKNVDDRAVILPKRPLIADGH